MAEFTCNKNMQKVELFSQKKRNIERELNQVINTIQNIWKERKKKEKNSCCHSAYPAVY